MSGFLDTNVIVRAMTGSPPALAGRAVALIEREPDLRVSNTVVAEAVTRCSHASECHVPSSSIG